MLTAAGMSSLAKILGAFESESIPASIRINNPQLPEDRIVRTPSQWQKTNSLVSGRSVPLALGEQMPI